MSPSRLVLGVAWCATAIACSAVPSAPEESTSTVASEAEPTLKRWAAPNRRLTRFELAYAIEDVFGVDATTLHSLPRPHSSIGIRPDILVGSLLDVSDAFLAPYRTTVRDLSELVATEIDSTCAHDADARSCAEGMLLDAGLRLWRRPLSEEEAAALLPGGSQTDDDASSLRSQVAAGVLGLLTSERFFLLENEIDEAREEPRARRLASRLALTLWSSVPDADLLAWAGTPEASTRSGVLARIVHMMDDPRFRRFARELGRQWLTLDRPATFRPLVESKAEVNDESLAERAVEELAERLFAALDTPVETLIDAPTDAAPHSADLLTSLAVLTAVSSPIDLGGNEGWLGRGVVIQSAMLCRTWPLAAVYPKESWHDNWLLDPSAPAERPDELALFAERTTEAPCRSCHAQLESLGAALGRFDGLGQPRDAPVVQAVAGMPRDVASLRGWVHATGRFATCAATKLATYVLSRSVAPSLRDEDRARIETLVSARPTIESETTDPPPTLRAWLTTLLVDDAIVEPHPDVSVVRERPNPLPDAPTYRTPLLLPSVAEVDCSSFDAQHMLRSTCGDVACHGSGSPGGAFVGADEHATRRLLSAYRPDPTGPCADRHGLLPALGDDHDDRGLLIEKLTAAEELCGAPMPITGGPRSVDPASVVCLAEWIRNL